MTPSPSVFVYACVMRASASLGISLIVAPIITLAALAVFNSQPSHFADDRTILFYVVPLLSVVAVVAALRSSRFHVAALFCSFMTLTLVFYALSIDAGSAVWAVPPACWTLAGLLSRPAERPPEADAE